MHERLLIGGRRQESPANRKEEMRHAVRFLARHKVAFVILVAAWWRPWCAWILRLCGVLYCLAAASNHLNLL